MEVNNHFYNSPLHTQKKSQNPVQVWW